MQLNMKDYIGENKSLLGNMILHGLINSLDAYVADIVKSRDLNDGMVEVNLTVNGHDMNIESFVNKWQDQVKEMIRDEAQKISESEIKSRMWNRG